MLTQRRSATLAALAILLAGCGTRSVLMAESDGYNALRARDYERAADNFEYALDKSPSRLDSRIGYARALMGLDRPADARGQLEIALSIDPTNTEVVELLSEAMLRDGKVDEMLRFLRSRAEGRKTVDDWVRFGRFAARAGDADVAELALLTAARIDRGRTAEPQIALADFYTSVGDEEKALQRLRMALYHRPQDITIHSRIRALGANPTPQFATVPVEALGAQ